MKISTVSIIAMFLASVIVMPVGMSYAQGSGAMSNMTGTNQTITKSANSTMTNQTMTKPENSTGTNYPLMKTTANSTMTNHTMVTSTPLQSNNTQAALGVSSFIHKAVADFKQQGDETRKVIFDCRDRLQTAASVDVDSIKNDCSIQLNAIKAKYQLERGQYHDMIKQYRQSVMVFLSDARGLGASKAAIDGAVAQLAHMMQPLMSGGGMGYTSTVNNTHCVNPPNGPKIC